jgi:hypothetical protein
VEKVENQTEKYNVVVGKILEVSKHQMPIDYDWQSYIGTKELK